MLYLETLNIIGLGVGALAFYFLYELFRPRSDCVNSLSIYQATKLAIQRDSDFLDWLEEFIIRDGNKNFRMMIFGQPTFHFVSDPSSVEHILKTNFKNYGKGPAFYNRAKELLGNGIFNVDGDMWYMHRKVSARLFNVRNFRSHMVNVFNRNLNYILDVILDQAADRVLKQDRSHTVSSDTVDMHKVFYSYTLDSIGEIAFGENIGSLEGRDVQFAKAFDQCQFQINKNFTDPFWLVRRYLTPEGWQFAKNIDVLEDYAKDVITRRKKEGDLEARGDLISLFMVNQRHAIEEKRNDEMANIDDRYLRDVIMNFLIAGRDTTAQALSWSLYLLALHPEYQDALYEEATAIVHKNQEEGQENGEEGQENATVHSPEHISFENTKNMPMARAVFMETLRLYPSVPKEVKWSFKGDRLPNGMKIPPHSWVGFIPYVMGRDEALWEDPLTFKPERFIEDPKPSPFIFTAFQAGPRMCLGKDMAILEGQVALSRILMKYKFELACSPEYVTYTNSLTLPMKNGLPVRVTRR